MNHLRAILVILLAIAVPLAATASVMAPIAPCSTSHSSHTKATQSQGVRDCCDMAHMQSGFHKSTHKSPPCKTGVECKSCVTFSMAFSFIDTPTVLAPVRDVLTLNVATALHHNPFGLWRPPRSV